ncbi:hypothetical protein L6164_004471 [Bauhinia variegata]|uniref:Uncharacterized protein n=1 Tax=Bauhinia variegata TaxID=167791 RepID=A0ACB9Q3N1_BAUVA|nr:hypothetical protein L6164_004471 [Bauhinia variegata]
MAGLQRSEVSFRRQGSSGLVWDDKLLSGELNKPNQQEQGQERDKAEIKEVNAGTNVGSIERSRSNGGNRGYRTGKVSPAVEPPSPKLSACGFCGAFGKPWDKQGQRPKPGKHRSR